ncbi:hypothetical protein PO909_022703 [Leuciscus waleckii]
MPWRPAAGVSSSACSSPRAFPCRRFRSSRPPSLSQALPNQVASIRLNFPETGHPGMGFELSREQIPPFLGPKRVRLVVYDRVKPCTPQPPLVRRTGPAGSSVPADSAYDSSPTLRVLHSQLGLQVNWEKSKLTYGLRISFSVMEMDSVQHVSQGNMSGRYYTEVRKGPTETFQRLLGHMADTAAYSLASSI